MPSKTSKNRSHHAPRARAATTHGRPTDAGAAAREHYHREKARRAHRADAATDVMAEARREYLALLEAEAAKGRGGRPKKRRSPQLDAELVDEGADSGGQPSEAERHEE